MKRKHWLVVGGLLVLFFVLTLAKSALYENYKAEHKVGAIRFISCGPLNGSDPVYGFNIFAQQVGKQWKTVIVMFPQEMTTRIAMRSDAQSSNRPFDAPNYYMVVRGNEHKLTMDSIYLTDTNDVVATVPMEEVFSRPFDPDNRFEGYENELLALLKKYQGEKIIEKVTE